MKTLAIIFVALLAAAEANAQWWTYTAGMNYGFVLPTGGMKPYIKNGNSLGISFLGEGPSHRVAAGLELSYTGYGHSRRTEDYTFPDGTSAPMKLVVNNSFVSLMAVSRLYFVTDGPVRPYATLRAGYTWFSTNLSIVDPNEMDSCEPVESAMLYNDGTFAYSAGGGVSMDLAWMFKKMRKGLYFVDMSSTILQGGRISYMNEDAPAPQAPHNMGTRAKDVEARFINTETQVVHAHHVGYLYNSFVSMMDFRLGFSTRIMAR